MKKMYFLFLYFTLFIFFVVTCFFVINYFTGFFDPYIKKIVERSGRVLTQTETFIFSQAFAGISIGALILVFVLLIYPLIFTSINAKEYYKDFFFGVLTAIVFYITEQLEKIFSDFKSVDLLLFILLIIIITYLLIEAVASLFKNKQKAADFKSQAVANVLSGIIFSMILTVIKSFIV